MKIKSQEVFNKWKENNTDPYGSCIIRYAERWADMMEAEIDKGAKLEDIAERLSHEADTEGITGYMYGAAVHVLATSWEHGEELRVWHNKQYGVEGERTANPAVITIKTK